MPRLKIRWTKALVWGLVAAGILIVLDAVSKWLVQVFVPLGEPVTVIPNFFYINKSYNIAIAFSLGAQLGVWGRVINIAISLIMSVLIFGYWLLNDYRFRSWERAIAAMLGAGAVGNLIDRAFYWEATTGFDGVIDFFQFYLGGGPGKNVNFFNPFATFNFADACLTVGIVTLLVYVIVDMVKSRDRSLESDPRLEKKPEPIEHKEENPSEGESE